MRRKRRVVMRWAVCVAAVLFAGCGSSFFTDRVDTGDGTTTARFAYVANFNNGGAGTVTGFALNTTTGALTATGQAASTGGAAADGPAAALVVSSKFLYTANDAGSISGFTIHDTTGVLTAMTGSPFPAGVSPSALAADPTGKFLYSANTGAATIDVYTINATTGVLTPLTTVLTTDGSAGLAVHPTGKFFYAAVDSQGIDVFTIGTNGALTLLRNVPPLAGGRPQAVAVDGSGKFLYAADGVNGVEFYTINATTGDLTVGRATAYAAGTGPVAITADSAGKFVYVANQDSNNVSGYAILSDGTLTALSGSPYAVGSAGGNPSPIAIKMDPSEKFLYTANFNGGVSIFTLDTATAGRLLTPAASATAGANPAGIAFK